MLHQLLTHATGAVDVLRSLCEGAKDLSDAIAHAHLRAEPGTVHLYSNLGYALVGLGVQLLPFPARFVFRFVPGDDHARLFVKFSGVGERRR